MQHSTHITIARFSCACSRCAFGGECRNASIIITRPRVQQPLRTRLQQAASCQEATHTPTHRIPRIPLPGTPTYSQGHHQQHRASSRQRWQQQATNRGGGVADLVLNTLHAFQSTRRPPKTPASSVQPPPAIQARGSITHQATHTHDAAQTRPPPLVRQQAAAAGGPRPSWPAAPPPCPPRWLHPAGRHPPAAHARPPRAR